MPKWLEEEGDASINLDDVLSDVHEFFKTFPSNFWRRRETDTPIRYSYHSLDGELNEVVNLNLNVSLNFFALYLSSQVKFVLSLL